MLFVIAGLGNPGKEYGPTRHNVGFRVMDTVANRNHIPLDRKRFSGLTGKGTIGEHDVLLIKPMTFMNLSGSSVGGASRFYKVPVDRIAVVHDDVDLSLGRIQVRRGGGHGGHRGLRSVVQAHGDPDFVRIRIGVDRPTQSGDVSDFVLGAFTRDELPVVDDAIERAATAVETWLEKGLEAAMNRFNPWQAREEET
jgi:peptidyl-tRNA hydrolase, PTH1 family